jgi:hypothetical protein
MRSVGPRSGFLEAGQSFISPTKSLAATISRSIGREIATQMSSAVEDDESDEDASVEREDTGDDVDDSIVTTRRRIVSSDHIIRLSLWRRLPPVPLRAAETHPRLHRPRGFDRTRRYLGRYGRRGLPDCGT